MRSLPDLTLLNARIDNILEEQQRIWRYYQERVTALETRLDNLVEELAHR